MRTNLIIKKTFYICKNQFKDTINPLQLFVEKRQFFNQNNQRLNNTIIIK